MKRDSSLSGVDFFIETDLDYSLTEEEVCDLLVKSVLSVSKNTLSPSWAVIYNGGILGRMMSAGSLPDVDVPKDIGERLELNDGDPEAIKDLVEYLFYRS